MSGARIVPASELTNEAYHALPDIGSTTLKKWLGPKRYALAPDEPGPSLIQARIIGTCVHSLVLEGRQDWVEPFAMDAPQSVIDAQAAIAALKAEGVQRRGKLDNPESGKAQYAPHDDAIAQWESARESAREAHAADAEARNLYPLGGDDVELVKGVSAAVLANPIAAQMIDACETPELSIFWTEVVEVDGQTVEIPCKCRPDIPVWDTFTSAYVLGDLKATRFALTPAALGKESANCNWPFQAAFYRRGMNAGGMAVDSCMTVWASTSAPYGCEVTQFTTEDMDRADRMVDVALRNYARHLLQPERWEGLADDTGGPTITTLSLPRWWGRDIEGIE